MGNNKKRSLATSKQDDEPKNVGRKKAGESKLKMSLSVKKTEIKNDSESEIEEESSSYEENTEDESDGEDGDDEGEEDTKERTKPEKKIKKKKALHHDMAGFAATLSQLVSQKLPDNDNQGAVLSKNKTYANKIEEAKLEYKVKKQLAAEKKAKLYKDKIDPTKDTYFNLDFEKKLKKVATRGVVKLFNAIYSQRKANQDLAEIEAKDEKLEVAKMSRANFLDLLKKNNKSEEV